MTIADLKQGERFRVRLRDGGLGALYVFDRIDGDLALCYCAWSEGVMGVPAAIKAEGSVVVRDGRK